MTTTQDGIVRCTCTRIQLIDVFRDLPLTRHMHLEALGGLADSVLAALPEVPAGDAGLYRAVNDAIAAAIAAERERIADMADRNEAVCTGSDGTSCYFSALIREQP